MKKFILSLLAISTSFLIHAQNEHNLVPNPSFEEVDGKIKSAGQVTLASPWKAVNMQPVDLYSADAKNDEFGVPENKYGEEKAKTGNNYAGVAFYGYRGRMPRTYLGTQLTNPLIAGKEYCLKFHVSMSDRSKYASNNISMSISKEEIVEMSEQNLSLEPHAQSYTNKVFDQQFLWEPICRTYTAKGGEQYIVIGNFKTDEETTTEAVRLSREFSGRQEYNAYYYIDDVSVIAVEKLSSPKDCMCDKIAGGAMKVEYKEFGTEESQRASAKKTYLVNSDGSKAESTISKNESAAAAVAVTEVKEAAYSPENTEVMFASTKFNLASAEASKVDELADYLKAHPDKKVEVIGHCDPSESEVKILGKRRAFMIKKELVDRGVNDSQISYVGIETAEPKDKSKPASNQRVTFVIK